MNETVFLCCNSRVFNIRQNNPNSTFSEHRIPQSGPPSWIWKPFDLTHDSLIAMPNPPLCQPKRYKHQQEEIVSSLE